MKEGKKMNETMIISNIDNESKIIFKQLKGIFASISADAKSIVYIASGILYYMSGAVSGMLNLEINNVSVFSELKDGHEYELSKLPGNKYRLTMLPYDKDKKDIYEKIIETNTLGNHICSIDADEYGVLSKISIMSKCALNDDFAKSISRFGTADVYMNAKKNSIILMRAKNEDVYSYMIRKSYQCVDFDDLEAEKEYKKNL